MPRSPLRRVPAAPRSASRSAQPLRSALRPSAALALAVAGAAFAPPAAADEGMWTLDHPPLARLEQRYGFVPPAGWLERMRHASVNFGGGSGAFVSAEGLVVTNQHVARSTLARVSGPGRDLVEHGYGAATRADELPCPGLDVRVLQSAEDVTARIRAAVDPRAAPAARDRQRREAMARLEREASRASGLEARVVELYRGGEYWLQRSKVHSDVRLVWAPEERTASHGGDPDNFGYPRHDLDVAFFRVYENGKPLRSEHWLRWNPEGPKEGDLVLTFGHPGSTNRFATVSQLEFRRDVHLPSRLRIQSARLAVLERYAARGAEAARQAAARISGLENNLKRERAYLEVLEEAPLMASLREAEDRLRSRVAAVPALAADAGGAWERIAAAQAEARRRWAEWQFAEMSRIGGLIDVAFGIVRLADQSALPNDRRWPEFREQNLPSTRRRLASPAPYYVALDEAVLAGHLSEARAALGDGAAFVAAALDGRTPEQAARAAFEGTTLADADARRRLIEGGARAVAASTDPLIRFARRVEPVHRELRAWNEEQVAAVASLEGGAIARARFALDGHDAYPDATGTLRLGYGRVAGYPQLTSRVPWKTNFYSLYGRTEAFDRKPPFDLPERVMEARTRIDLATPLNFTCTNDIIGGSSGSPVVARDGRLVGVVFDGNVQAFRWDVAYDDAQARCVAVHAAGVIAALRGIYGMNGLADELADPLEDSASR